MGATLAEQEVGVNETEPSLPFSIGQSSLFTIDLFCLVSYESTSDNALHYPTTHKAETRRETRNTAPVWRAKDLSAVQAQILSRSRESNHHAFQAIDSPDRQSFGFTYWAHKLGSANPGGKFRAGLK